LGIPDYKKKATDKVKKPNWKKIKEKLKMPSLLLPLCPLSPPQTFFQRKKGSRGERRR